MLTQPRFSIVLPTHNRAEVLRFAIESVLCQTEPDFELLVVGDGCTDNTAEVVRSFADPRLRWLDLPKSPHFGYANRNRGFRECRGELIAAMAHDDLWLPDHLELLGRCFADDTVELAYSLPVWVLPDGLVVPTPFCLADADLLAGFLALERNYAAAACFIHRRRCFARYGFWNEELTNNGDQEMWARIIAGGDRRNFCYLPVPTTLHYRADWRANRPAGPTILQIWRALREDLLRAAPQLQIQLLPGRTEQEATWAALQADPEAWTRQLRAGLELALHVNYGRTNRGFLQPFIRQQTQEAAIWQARAAARRGSEPPPEYHYRLSFESGFHADEGWRWAARDARLLMVFRELPKAVIVECRCGAGTHYGRFPFAVTITVNEAPLTSWQFTEDHEARSFSFQPPGGEVRLRLASEACFVPALAGISADIRELAVQITSIEVIP